MFTFLQVATTTAPKTVSLGELILAGGWLMIPLLALFGISIFIFVERFRIIRRASSIDVDFMNKIKDLMYENKIDLALKLCRGTDNPVAR
ncbi:MAG: MotA/TolQ/ExbB proton channel family protein, partial [Rikenellaceae bacterium]